MIKFLSVDAWKEIRRLSKGAINTKIAVAYFGNNASTMLHFKMGDTLIVALTTKNVESGQVNPFEIEILLDKGINVYTLKKLHSKVFLFDNKVIVGSTNISYNSENNLIEGVVLTDDIGVIKQVENFFLHYAIEKVNKGEYLELLKKKYNPSNFINDGVRRVKNKQELSPLWIVSTDKYYSTTLDEIALAKDQNKFVEEIDVNRYVVDEIRFKEGDSILNRIKKGDLIVEIYNRKSIASVLCPKRVIGFTHNKEEKNVFIRVEERKELEKISWTKFQAILHKNNIHYIKKTSTREIKNEDVKRLIHTSFD